MAKILEETPDKVTIVGSDGQPFAMPRKAAEDAKIVVPATPPPTGGSPVMPVSDESMKTAMDKSYAEAGVMPPDTSEPVKPGTSVSLTGPMVTGEKAKIPLLGQSQQASAPAPEAKPGDAQSPLADLPGASVQAPKQPQTAGAPTLVGTSADEKALKADQEANSKAAHENLSQQLLQNIQQGREMSPQEMSIAIDQSGVDRTHKAALLSGMQQLQQATMGMTQAVQQYTADSQKRVSDGPWWKKALNVIGAILTVGGSVKGQQEELDRQLEHDQKNIDHASGLIQQLREQGFTPAQVRAAYELANIDLLKQANAIEAARYPDVNVKAQYNQQLQLLNNREAEAKAKIFGAVSEDRARINSARIGQFNAETERRRLTQKAGPSFEQDKDMRERTVVGLGGKTGVARTPEEAKKLNQAVLAQKKISDAVFLINGHMTLGHSLGGENHALIEDEVKRINEGLKSLEGSDIRLNPNTVEMIQRFKNPNDKTGWDSNRKNELNALVNELQKELAEATTQAQVKWQP